MSFKSLLFIFVPTISTLSKTTFDWLTGSLASENELIKTNKVRIILKECFI
jgi:hypothetical protein